MEEEPGESSFPSAVLSNCCLRFDALSSSKTSISEVAELDWLWKNE